MILTKLVLLIGTTFEYLMVIAYSHVILRPFTYSLLFLHQKYQDFLIKRDLYCTIEQCKHFPILIYWVEDFLEVIPIQSQT